LINTHFEISFSRYLRQVRVERAKVLLQSEPNASILSISLETGFRSQSNFYAAFKEITGKSPGIYRKKLMV
jgi:transcriptional regulator GlxA family with amidase domain